MPLIAKALIAVAAVWGLVFGTLQLAGFYKVTPEKVEQYAREHPLDDSMSDEARLKIVEGLANRVNQLDDEQRKRSRENRKEDGEMEAFFKGFRKDEWARFVELTAGPHFDAAMRNFNKMEPAERKEMVAEILKNMKEGDRLSPRESEELEAGGVELFEKIADEGVRSYYSEASAATKIDLAPVLEQMQKTMQERGGRRGLRPQP